MSSRSTPATASGRRRRVEDVRVHAVACPAQELLGERSRARPSRTAGGTRSSLNQQEQVDAEDDGERAEAEHERAPVRPREQAVEGVGEQGKLRGDQRRRRDRPRASSSPKQDDRGLLDRPAGSAAAPARFRAPPSATRSMPNRSPTHASRNSAAPTREARTVGRCCSTESWLSTSRPATKPALRAKAPPADSLVPAARCSGRRYAPDLAAPRDVFSSPSRSTPRPSPRPRRRRWSRFEAMIPNRPVARKASRARCAGACPLSESLRTSSSRAACSD